MNRTTATNLFELPPAPPAMPLLSQALAMPFGGGFTLRDYQREDVLAALNVMTEGKRGVVVEKATGLGKAVDAAELARRLSVGGRVLVVVDVGNLADDLAQTIYRHTGKAPGVLTGTAKENWRQARIVVATVQTLYSGEQEENGWCRQLPPREFSAVIVDECETSIAERYSWVINYFREGNPALVLVGLSATPFRSDGQGMGKLYDYAADAPGPLKRDILWGRDNGWLVGVRQAFVRVSLDYSTFVVRKDEDGVKDYTDAEQARRLLESEQVQIELAKGIHRVAQGEPSIVICPNDVKVAKSVAHYLDAESRGCANAVYGEQGKRADDLIAAFKRGDYPYITSVNKLYKGFDSDRVKFVFMARKTNSKRIYQQSLGRGTRPKVSIRDALAAAATPEERRAIIAASDKPFMVMVDMVGVDESAKDLGVIDILNGSMPEEARERAKRKMLAADAGDAQDTDEAGRDAAKELAEEARQRDEAERRRRSRVQVNAQVEVEYQDDLRVSGGKRQEYKHDFFPKAPGIPYQLKLTLAKYRVPEKHVSRMSPEKADEICKRLRQRDQQGLVAHWNVCERLERCGFTKAEIKGMTKGEAGGYMAKLKQNNWRPMRFERERVLV